MSDAVETTTPDQTPETPIPDEATPLTLRGRWQIPLLGIGLLVLGGGIYRIAAAYEHVTFQDEITRITRLQDAGALNIAHRYIVDTLKQAEERPADERAELQRQLARTIFLAQRRSGSNLPVNNAAVLRSYQAARSLGATLTSGDWVNLGETYQATGAFIEAIASYRKALAMRTEEPDRLRRRLIELQLTRGDEWTAEMIADLDAIIDGEPDASDCLHAASNRNYVWAIEQRVNLLIDAGETAPARKLVSGAAQRLKGSQALPRVQYLEALVLKAEGRLMDAEDVLRALRNDWTMRDALWAQAGLLLGRLQQEDDRPEAALSFYDDVLRTFNEGAIYDACLLGRAECLAALERYDTSLDEFKSLIANGPRWTRPGRVDRAVVRTTITTIGETLLRNNRLELGVEYLRLALSLVDDADAKLRATYLSRITTTLAGIARRELELAKANNEDTRKALGLFAKTAESYLELAMLQTSSEDSARSKELAADNFDAAGMTERVVDVLSAFVQQYPRHPHRPGVLYRLGQANHALKRYRPAIAAYDAAIKEYPRTPNALSSIVPLAECLLQVGGEEAKRGVDILVGVVDDRGPDMLFTPQAKEYRAASILLAEYYSRANEEQVPGHLEKAIVRLEAALTHYPDDALAPKLTFLLGESYRQSGTLLAKEASSLSSDAAKENAQIEARRRLDKAIDAYADVISMLARYDEAKLNVVERTYLKASYLYRADCLFDLGHYGQAMEAYTEAAWRYDNMPASVSASMQVVQCQLRLGRKDEARAALARLKWTLAKIPATAFDTERGMSPKKYWEDMVERMTTSGLY